jgi:hypothetical protein
VSSAWPFAALVYLVVLAAGARRKPPGEADALR